MLHNSPDEILLYYANQMIANSSCSQSKFVHELLLPALTESGVVEDDEPKTAEDYEKWRSAKVRQINSVLNGKTKIPLCWLWPWLDVLPEPYGSKARKDFFAQAGVMDVSPVDMEVAEYKADLPSLFREVADVMSAGSGVAADGKYDSDDSPEELLALANEIVDVVEVSFKQLLALSAAVDLTNERASIFVQMFIPTNVQNTKSTK